MEFLKTKRLSLCVLTVGSFLLLSGCVVRSYPLVKDRVDQDLTGNRGYLMGRACGDDTTLSRKTTRMTRVVEIELRPAIKTDKKSKTQSPPPQPQALPQEQQMWGNRGGVSEGTTQVIQEIPEPPTGTLVKQTQSYKVEKGDTLQKISMRFYGTTKRWMKIFEANKETLKSPEKLYPGQVLAIPVEQMQEPRENLK